MFGVAGCSTVSIRSSQPYGQAAGRLQRCRSENGLPDRSCTPGAVTAGATRRIVCIPGYFRRTRPPVSYTEPLKRRLLAAYGYTGQPLSRFRLDHLIPIAIGGAPRAVANLWPERSGGNDGYQAKDQIEIALARAGCAGRVDLHAAQTAIAHDWRTSLKRLHLPAPSTNVTDWKSESS